MTPKVLRLLLFPLLILAVAGVRAAELEVIVEPENDALQSNIRAHVGDLGDRNAASLRRFAAHARDSATEAIRALGYYDGDIRYQVVEGDPPVLRLEVAPGEPVRLTVTEFLILQALATRPGYVKSRDNLMDAAYDDQVYVDDRTIDSHIKRIRKKFRESDKSFDAIETLYGVGYRYKED